jgi:hypothetical protein
MHKEHLPNLPCALLFAQPTRKVKRLLFNGKPPLRETSQSAAKLASEQLELFAYVLISSDCLR